MTLAPVHECVRAELAWRSPSHVRCSPPWQAQSPTDADQKEANTHFQRAVSLYSEADYRAALVEFKRAYEIAPHPSVLYNIGEAYYQLQNYAAALDTFEKFVADGGTTHKSEVENTIAILKTRVGKVDITTPTPGWDITIDDEPAGKTPLAKPVSVSIGHRKVTRRKGRRDDADEVRRGLRG